MDALGAAVCHQDAVGARACVSCLKWCAAGSRSEQCGNLVTGIVAELFGVIVCSRCFVGSKKPLNGKNRKIRAHRQVFYNRATRWRGGLERLRLTIRMTPPTLHLCSGSCKAATIAM